MHYGSTNSETASDSYGNISLVKVAKIHNYHMLIIVRIRINLTSYFTHFVNCITLENNFFYLDLIIESSIVIKFHVLCSISHSLPPLDATWL